MYAHYGKLLDNSELIVLNIPVIYFVQFMHNFAELRQHSKCEISCIHHIEVV